VRERHSIGGAYRALIAAVITRAIDDLKGTDPLCQKNDIDRAMAFILSDDCEAYCLELDIDYEAIRKKAAALYRQVLEKEPERKPRKIKGTVR
jgi:hypothetical protein